MDEVEVELIRVQSPELGGLRGCRAQLRTERRSWHYLSLGLLLANGQRCAGVSLLLVEESDQFLNEAQQLEHRLRVYFNLHLLDGHLKGRVLLDLGASVMQLGLCH